MLPCEMQSRVDFVRGEYLSLSRFLAVRQIRLTKTAAGRPAALSLPDDCPGQSLDGPGHNPRADILSDVPAPPVTRISTKNPPHHVESNGNF